MNYSKLIELYTKTSKHSHYQILAKPLRKLISNHILGTQSRYENERLNYIIKHMQCKGIALADIGGNTGYFTLEFIDRGAKSAIIIEGNKSHSNFVNEAAMVLGWQDRVRVHPYYISFDNDFSLIDTDVTLLLNVLHHVGDDYGKQTQSINAAKVKILDSLSRLSKQTEFLVFQLGFNWKGDIRYPLFEEGTKKELIEYIEYGTEDSWAIEHIGIAEKLKGRIVYNEMDPHNLRRKDSLGEFLNRPLFIMRSKSYRNYIT